MSRGITVFSDRPADNARRPLDEERANCLTHAFGLALALIGAAYLIHEALNVSDGALHTLAWIVYSITLVQLFAISTLYHCLHPDSRRKETLRSLDHTGIFLLIAGTYTAMVLPGVAHLWEWVYFSAVWVLALGGLILELYTNRYRKIRTAGFLLMGLLCVVGVWPVLGKLDAVELGWMATGALLYVAGVLFFWKDMQVKYLHTVWHLFVMAAAAAHYYVVVRYLVPWK